MAKKKISYRIGIDVGLNSTGLAAIEVDDDGAPIRILNTMSVIHDGGVDPDAAKVRGTRLAISGIARRTRRMRRRRAKRLDRLEQILEKYGYTDTEPVLEEPYGPWICRAELADGFINDDEQRRMMIGIAIRHIARHRGWRNPYQNVRALLNIDDSDLSEEYKNLKEKVQDQINDGKDLPNFTPSQLVRDYLDNFSGQPAARIRTGKAGPRGNRRDAVGILPQRMRQSDYAYELQRIFDMQKIGRDEAQELLMAVFEAKSPKGSAEKRIGKDPLTGKKRALKASLAFQKYRIVATITNLRIKTGTGSERMLSPTELNDIYTYLLRVQDDNHLPTWEDICEEVLHIGRYQLAGIGKTFEGGERISNMPPVIQTSLAIHGLSEGTLAEKLTKWWDKADDDSRESMIKLLSNTVDIDRVNEVDENFASALDFIDSLDDEELTKLDKIALPRGRAAYSEEALNKLTADMLNTGDDLFSARQRIYHVNNSWRPPQPPIGEPLGNPAVDRVLKITNRYLMNCLNRWGQPRRVTIEHTRSGFTSVKQATEHQKISDKRAEYRRDIVKQLEEAGVESVHEYDIRRWEAVQRQNGQCLYCGRDITFKTCEMDHIVPRKGPGSTNTRTNFAAVCPECNRMKSNIPFASWAETKEAKDRGVSLDKAIKQVRFFNFTKNEYSPQAQRNFKKSMIERLKQKTSDEPLDNRSIESVSWMADELYKRIDWYFNHEQYETSKKAINDDKDNLSGTQVVVYPGSITAEARNAAGLGGNIHFIGGRYKTRLDRRHHAVDACVIAMMEPGIARILTERNQLRQAQRLTARIEDDEVNWKDYPTENTAGYNKYQAWSDRMHALLEYMNNALDYDKIPVVRWERLQLGNRSAHEDTIHPLKKLPLSHEISAIDINHASTPALYEALVSLPDFSEQDGLPADPSRQINVNGERYSGDDLVSFFNSNAAQIAIQGGSAELGTAFHHARIYRCWTVGKNGKKKIFFGMIRVYQHDLLHAKNEDLFTYPLKRSSVSMRYAKKEVVHAILSGNAEYVGYLCVGDELVLDLKGDKSNDEGGSRLSGQVGEFVQKFEEDSKVNSQIVNRWTVDGFPDEAKLRLRPSMFAGEGLKNMKSELVENAAIKNILSKTGWRVSVDVISKKSPVVLRRNAFGEPRWKTNAGLPVSYRWQDTETKE
ncbi:restriction endonuclease [Scardovia inopinata]|uniref:HNH Cas9-type domain-containing protein n=1 Tax=Scardovia inopinata F0304 TaxID=641146 RepID=W5IIZ2_SCAIO|nr:type II CRISPR RNA-guided endonuclease Cas9 [Scardovia inopinata]EFG26825.2 hypothetical protein HMPREF9020_00453 [Scardovia inopinata F0304]BAR06428.1 CRISPR-associated protein [Scardovia inopinata JCM 12537]SUV51944.1 restriction endonuclease [Scardovia inopinata]